MKIEHGWQVTETREALGLSKAGLAKALRLGANGRQTIRRIEAGKYRPTGPMQLALEALRDGWRPSGVKLPIDEAE